jgi:hypothetical protein
MIFCIFPLFPMCSHHVPKMFPSTFPKMFPIALGFYAIWFAQSLALLYINKIGKSRGGHLFIFCNLGSKEMLLLGACTMFQENC